MIKHNLSAQDLGALAEHHRVFQIAIAAIAGYSFDHPMREVNCAIDDPRGGVVVNERPILIEKGYVLDLSQMRIDPPTPEEEAVVEAMRKAFGMFKREGLAGIAHYERPILGVGTLKALFDLKAA
jgi:hypothetical protein